MVGMVTEKGTGVSAVGDGSRCFIFAGSAGGAGSGSIGITAVSDGLFIKSSVASIRSDVSPVKVRDGFKGLVLVFASSRSGPDGSDN